MPEIRVQRDTKVILSLTEREAEILNAILWNCVDHSSNNFVSDLGDMLSEERISTDAVKLIFNGDSDLFEVHE